MSLVPSAAAATTNTKTRPSDQLPSLPYDMLLFCLAHVPRQYYPKLSLVSKKFRSLLASHELNHTRSLLGRTNIALYVCLSLENEGKACWYTLIPRSAQVHNPQQHHQIITNLTSNYKFEHVLVPIQSNKISFVIRSGFVAVGSYIYSVGVDFHNWYRVSILDCKSHKWYKGPNTLLDRVHPKVQYLGGKIYVMGGNISCDSSNWIEVFDPKTETWEYLPECGMEFYGRFIYKSIAIKGKLYLCTGNKCVVYDPNETRWENVESRMVRGWKWEDFCVIDDILYCWNFMFKWYDWDERVWRDLKGLDMLTCELPDTRRSVKVASYGKKMVSFWLKKVDIEEYKVVTCCAVIALERLNKHEIKGNVEWIDVVLDKPCDLVNVIDVHVS